MSNNMALRHTILVSSLCLLVMGCASVQPITEAVQQDYSVTHQVPKQSWNPDHNYLVSSKTSIFLTSYSTYVRAAAKQCDMAGDPSDYYDQDRLANAMDFTLIKPYLGAFSFKCPTTGEVEQ